MYLSVYKVIEDPACSNPAQKKITKKVNMKITVIRCFSSNVSGFLDDPSNNQDIIMIDDIISLMEKYNPVGNLWIMTKP